MVRLLLPPQQYPTHTLFLFQSHNGAIAALIGLFAAVGLVWVSIPQWCDCCGEEVDLFVPGLLFQSHNGAIAAVILRKPTLGWSKVSIPQWCDCCCLAKFVVLIVLEVFQSHNGAIAARKRPPNQPAGAGFQSHNGAIAALPEFHFAVFAELVSIPQWCDCCLATSPEPPFRFWRFNPTMVRLLRLHQ